jgi:hypothetical protein
MSKFDEFTRPIFFQPGHNAGDLVESMQWKILREERGRVSFTVTFVKSARATFRRFYWNLRGHDFDLYNADFVLVREQISMVFYSKHANRLLRPGYGASLSPDRRVDQRRPNYLFDFNTFLRFR